MDWSFWVGLVVVLVVAGFCPGESFMHDDFDFK